MNDDYPFYGHDNNDNPNPFVDPPSARNPLTIPFSNQLDSITSARAALQDQSGPPLPATGMGGPASMPIPEPTEFFESNPLFGDGCGGGGSRGAAAGGGGYSESMHAPRGPPIDEALFERGDPFVQSRGGVPLTGPGVDEYFE